MSIISGQNARMARLIKNGNYTSLERSGYSMKREIMTLNTYINIFALLYNVYPHVSGFLSNLIIYSQDNIQIVSKAICQDFTASECAKPSS